MRTWLSLTLVLTLSSTLHCSDDDSNLASYACEVPGKLCTQYENLSSDELASVKQGCATPSGSASEVKACSADNRIGSCVKTVGAATQTTFYYAGGSAIDTAKKVCEQMGGAFTPQ